MISDLIYRHSVIIILNFIIQIMSSFYIYGRFIPLRIHALTYNKLGFFRNEIICVKRISGSQYPGSDLIHPGISISLIH